ncbi:MAG: FtsX-like permease family protein [Woeseiaceae bacterium]|nr:FtsX-like permease family protein [Woeseiaceae bacterium]
MARTLIRANAGFLARHPWQLAMVFLGVGIGVAVIVAVDLANASARKAFLLSMDTLTGQATHQVVGGPAGIDEAVYVRLRVEEGIGAIAPVVEGYVEVSGRTLRVLGIDPFAEQEIRSFTTRLDEEGTAEAENVFAAFLTRPGAAVLAATTAARLDLATGDEFEVIAAGRAERAVLVGTYAAAGADDLLTVDIATAQAWFGREGRLSRIDVRLPADEDGAKARFAAALPSDTTLLSAAGRTQSTADMSNAFMTNLTAMSLLALLVGLFLIYNSVSFSVLQRRGLIGVLRALGVTRAQVFRIVLAEAEQRGLVAAAAGVAFGVWLGERLLALVAQSINDFYFRVTVTDVAIGGLSLAKGVAAGVGAALAGALVPAVEAAGFRPRLALARSVLERRTGNLLPVVTAAGVILVLAAILLVAVSGRSLVAGLTAVFMLILGVALCVPLAVGRLSARAAPLFGRAGGVIARLAVSDIAAGLSRTGVAIVALAVAVAATIGVSVMVDSFRGSVADWLTGTLSADVYAGVERGSLAPGLVAAFRATPGVAAMSTTRRAWLEDEGGRTELRVLGMVPESRTGIELLEAADDVWTAFGNADVVLVSEPYAYRNRVGTGSVLSLRTGAGEAGFRVAGVYQSYDINASAILMSRSTYDRHFDDPRVDSVGLYLEPGIDPDRVIAALEALAEGTQELVIDSNRNIRELSLAIFDRTFRITDVLYWLALGVAMIGILGAMLALQLERARDLAILRAVGMTPRQLGAMIVLQTAVIGLFAGLAAIPLGTAMAWLLIDVINRRAFGWQIDMSVGPEILLSSTLFAILAAVLAGLYPARRAATSVPALAMREE